MTDERVRIQKIETLSAGWNTVTRQTLLYRRADGIWQELVREIADHGGGAAILLFDPDRRTVILVRQFRAPVHQMGDGDGFLIEVPAGLLDHAAPADRIRAETEEETGYRITDVQPVFEAYMSPGSLTEKITCFVANYTPADRISSGGGLPAEGEDIEVLELPLDTALAMIRTAEIRDAKTIMLLQHAALGLA